MQITENLVRKQYLIAPRQINKLKDLAEKQNTSAAEIVRMAIDAFDPDVPADLNESELFDLVSTRVKEAIADTVKTRERLHNTLALLGEK
ncbi:hypothetical protein DGMP_01700 [Desulfomarina profundi]|uniref:Ribbon-helix-helix protein CopG domain-containing protein n=1 Tax=Desulfomarina profundi TaxID=2772557 RepID=A0A8D5FTA4_9BACT|nr:hypothetical protein [Desulfomarina profundi]BCL59477.1 hypothetical protein DGMP_01700 [Desulfomarina profundi]